MFGGGQTAQPVGATRSFSDRLIGAARLDRSVYEEVERDTTATQQAAIVVGIAAIASAIGGLNEGWEGALAGLIGAIVGWLISSAFIYIVGTRIIPSDRVQADYGQVLRTQGFAAVPNVLLVLGFIPIIGGLVALVAAVWYIITRIVGIQSALEASVGRAIGIAIIAVILQAIVLAIIAAIFGVGLYGIGAIS